MPRAPKDALVFNVGVYGQPKNRPFDPVKVNRDLEAKLYSLNGRKARDTL
jgi:hypothetical protein